MTTTGNERMVIIFQAPFAQTCMGFKAGADYAAVWMERSFQTIDEIWVDFNRIDEFELRPPDEYKGRSLSIGDVVAVGDVFYTPEFVGWRELTPDERREVLLAAARNLKAKGAEIEVE